MTDIIEQLQKILTEGDKPLLILKFQQQVWSSDRYDHECECVQNVLLDLALDLDYYEPNEILRRESHTFYSDERLKEEIGQAVEEIIRCREISTRSDSN